MEKRRGIEIAIAAVFVVLLVLVSVLVVRLYNGTTSTTSTSTVTNSYNTYNYYRDNMPIQTSSGVAYKPYIVDSGDYYMISYVDRDLRYADVNDRYLDYNSYSYRNVVAGVFGQDINNYEVYVRNHDYIGGYFKVTYYFEDRYGRETSYSVTKYVDARDEGKFVYKDITNKYEYSHWHYKIESMTKAPTKIYYNN